jgi:hypothetical protein
VILGRKGKEKTKIVETDQYCYSSYPNQIISKYQTMLAEYVYQCLGFESRMVHNLYSTVLILLSAEADNRYRSVELAC